MYKNPVELNDNYVNKILTVCPYLESLDHNEVTNQNNNNVNISKDNASNNPPEKPPRDQSADRNLNSKTAPTPPTKPTPEKASPLPTNVVDKNSKDKKSPLGNIDLSELDKIKTKLGKENSKENKKEALSNSIGGFADGKENIKGPLFLRSGFENTNFIQKKLG